MYLYIYIHIRKGGKIKLNVVIIEEYNFYGVKGDWDFWISDLVKKP